MANVLNLAAGHGEQAALMERTQELIGCECFGGADDTRGGPVVGDGKPNGRLC
ncbi:hypothetical protein [Nonomuraea insulae]|uniref:Uncharacterized protein n=1 Tax=Nonomuraea insulae TaxID=1616787 RepID=A0ABW1CLX7_9ACTN